MLIVSVVDRFEQFLAKDPEDDNNGSSDLEDEVQTPRFRKKARGYLTQVQTPHLNM